MGRNNADFHEGKDIPGFEGTMAAFNNLIKSGEAIIEKRKPKPEVDTDAAEDLNARAEMDEGK